MQDVQCVLPIGYMMRERYVVEDVLGKGGFGAVYLVRDVRQDLKPFALKEVVGPKGKEGHRFISQTTLLRHLDHPALPRVHEVFSGDKRDRVYILADYIEGPNLERVRQLQPEKRFSLPQVMTLVAPIVHAVSYLHSQHPPLIHRDIKPSNIILPEAGNGTVLVDFGIADAYDSDTITATVGRGTPGYRAPARFDGGSAPRTDIYSLGAILYLLLTGTVPIDAFDRLKKLDDKEPDPLLPVNRVVPTVPTTVARAIHRALSLSSDHRLSSVEEFWDALWQLSTANLEMQLARETEVAAPPDGHTELLANQVVQQVVELAAAASTEEGPNSISNQMAQRAPEDSIATPDPAHTPAIFEEVTRPVVVPVQGRPPVHRLRKPGLLVLILLVLFVTLFAGLGLWFYVAGHRSPASALPATAHPSKAPSPAGPGSEVTSTATHPTTLSNLASSYVGTIYDIAGSISAKMSLTAIQQNQGNISGNFTGLHRTGTFNGIFDSSKHIQFTVKDSAGHLILSFDGDMQSSGDLSGSYCSVDQNARCTGDYGLWSVAPAS